MERCAAAVWTVILSGLLFAIGAHAQTGCGTLSQCPVASIPFNGNELLYIVQNGLSKQIGVSNFIGQNILPLNNIFTGVNAFIPLIPGNGIVTADGADLTVQNTPTTAFSMYSPTSTGLIYSDIIRSVAVVNNGTNTSNVDAYGAYIECNIVSTGFGQNCADFFGVAYANVDNASVWGLNTASTDSQGSLTPLPTSGRKLIGAEFDFNPLSNNGGTLVEGVGLILTASVSQPPSEAFTVNAYGTYPWQHSFVSDAGAAQVGAIFAASTTGVTNIASQPVYFGVQDSASVGHYLAISGIPSNTVTALQIVDLTRANGIALQTAATGASPTIYPVGTDTDINLFLAAKNGGFLFALSSFLPLTTATYQLGTSSQEWLSVYAGAYIVGATPGATCTGAPDAGFRSINGIVTGC